MDKESNKALHYSSSSNDQLGRWKAMQKLQQVLDVCLAKSDPHHCIPKIRLYQNTGYFNDTGI